MSGYFHGPPDEGDAHARTRSSRGLPAALDISLGAGEEAIRYRKSSESVDAAFAAEGFPNLPGLAAPIVSFVQQSTRGISLSTIANASAGTGPLNASATSGVSLLLGTMTPQQREAMKAGVNPLDPAAVHKFTLALNSMGAYASAARGESGLGGSNGGRFSGMRESADARQAADGGLGGAYSSLLKQGYHTDQLNAVMPYARELGWTDKQSLRMLADTGPAGGELAKKFEDARKRGDKAGMDQARQEAREKAKSAKTEKERKGWQGLQKKFEGINKSSAKNRLATEAENASPSSASPPATAKPSPEAAIINALRQKRAAQQQKP